MTMKTIKVAEATNTQENDMPVKTIKVAETTNAQLDWLVAKCEGVNVWVDTGFSYYPRVMKVPPNDVWGKPRRLTVEDGGVHYRPTTDWSQMGPIIEREGISTRRVDATNDDEVDADMHHWWVAADSRKTLNGYVGLGLEDNTDLHWAPTALIAAARCYVTSKLGETAEVPEELT